MTAVRVKPLTVVAQKFTVGFMTQTDVMTAAEAAARPRVIPQWTLGDRLRKARESAGLGQAELADKIGIARTSIVTYENDRQTPRQPVLLSWALCCCVDLTWLVAGDTP
jgi:DNA-binding XRE family transcriptional regulator